MKKKLLSGDRSLTVKEHIYYFGFFAIEFLKSLNKRKKAIFFSPNFFLSPLLNESVSPFRILQECFLREKMIPNLVAPAKILEVGCGRGQNLQLFEDLNFSGYYLGIDVGHAKNGALHNEVTKEWNHPKFKGIGKKISFQFLQMSIFDFFDDSKKKFNCIFSISVLEHIEDVAKAAKISTNLMTDDGISVHIVPATLSYFLYIAHGYRRFSSAALYDLFYQPGKKIEIYRLGGAISFLIHFTMITIPIRILKIDIRNIFPNFYRKVLFGSISMDRFFPFCHVGFSVVIKNSR